MRNQSAASFVIIPILLAALSACGMDFGKTSPSIPQQGGLGDPSPPPTPYRPFVLAGYRGTLLLSADFTNWTQAPVSTGPYADNNYNFRGSCFGNGTLIVVGGGAPDPGQVMQRIATTTNGKDWTEIKLNRQWLGACAFGNQVLIAGGGYGHVSRSVDNGKTWDELPFLYNSANGTVFVTRGMRFLNGRFYLYGDAGLATTANGDTFEFFGAMTGVSEIQYGNGVFVMRRNGELQHSVDFLTWTPVTPSIDVHSVTFDGSKFRAFNQYSQAYESANGFAWNAYALPSTQFAWVIYSGGTYAAIAYGATLFTSEDAVTWIDRGSHAGFTIINTGVKATLTP